MTAYRGLFGFMKKSYYNFYLCCLLVLLTNGLFADENRLNLTTTTCVLDVSQQQHAALLDLCIESAETGDANAQYQLGLYYSEGKLTSPDFPKAINYFKEASLQAHVDAQLHLGYMYFKGQGTPTNNLQAYIIFKIAGINGSDEAMDEADIVATYMTPTELQQASIILGKTFRNYMMDLKINKKNIIPSL